MNVYGLCALSNTHTQTHTYVYIWYNHVSRAYVPLLLHATYMFILLFYTSRRWFWSMHIFLAGRRIIAFKLNGLSVRFCSNKLFLFSKKKKNCESSLYYKLHESISYLIWTGLRLGGILFWFLHSIWFDFYLHFQVSVHFSTQPYKIDNVHFILFVIVPDNI